MNTFSSFFYNIVYNIDANIDNRIGNAIANGSLRDISTQSRTLATIVATRHAPVMVTVIAWLACLLMLTLGPTAINRAHAEGFPARADILLIAPAVSYTHLTLPTICSV